MAWITSIERKEGTGKIQPSQLVAYAKIFETLDQTTVFQIDTYGSSDREFPNKQSQTLQFGRETAKQLYELLRDTYQFEK
jgi:hypothetical protein